MKKPFTQDEITICAYLALYGPDDTVGPEDVQRLKGRNSDLIELKIQDIAFMLDEQGIPRCRDVFPMSEGTTSEEEQRTTWDWVEPLTKLSKPRLLIRCRLRRRR